MPAPPAEVPRKAPRRRAEAEGEPDQPWQEDGGVAAPAEVPAAEGVPVEAAPAPGPDAGGRIRFAEDVAQKDAPPKKKKSKKAEKKGEREVEAEGKAKKAPKRAKRLAVVDEDEDIDLEDLGNWTDKDSENEDEADA